jgi:uncharacterized protein YdeI (YjbR/CyaY-like superfamily)
METKQELPIIELADQRAWQQWLEENHDSSGGAWLKIAKKGAARSTVTYAEALEEALRYGWIDGQKGSYDESFWLQRFTRRGPRSRWSQINREKAEQLIASGKMPPPGLAQVQAARADGRWEAAYPAQSQATVPEDFQRELDKHPEAKAFFATLTGVHRYAFLVRLHNVSRPEARAKRIASYIALLREQRTLRS